MRIKLVWALSVQRASNEALMSYNLTVSGGGSLPILCWQR